MRMQRWWVFVLLAGCPFPPPKEDGPRPPAPPSDEISLRSRSFRPPEGIEPGLATAHRDGERHVLVQLRAFPDACGRADLEAHGVRLLGFLGNRTWYASVTSDRLFRPGAATPQVRWAGRIQPADRVSPNLRRLLGKEAAALPGKADLAVTFFRDAGAKERDAVLGGAGAKVLSAARATDTALVSVPLARVAGLAAADAVQWIERAAPAGGSESDRARAYVQVDAAQAAGLTGDGVVVGIFDGGHASDQHPALTGRVTRGDADAWDRAQHTTMMGGLVAGDGAQSPNGAWRGMAPAATLVTFDFFVGAAPTSAQQHANFLGDLEEAVATHGIAVACNPWGTFGCQEFEYGAYEGLCDELDAAVLGAHGRPVVVVFSSGNERDGFFDGAGESTACITDVAAPFANYRTINHPKAAKNVLLVGAVDSANDRMTSYSSWGPAADGRLKPEIVAGGHHNGGLRSEVTVIDNPFGSPDPGDPNQQDYRAPNHPTNDFVYAWAGQTSAAASVAAGASALLLEAWRTRLGTPSDPLPSTVKALLVHAARDLDDATAWHNPGPDYASGYGVLRIDDAIGLVGTGRHIEGKVAQGDERAYTVVVPAGTTSFRATLAWDDPPAAQAALSALVNDLDLVVVDPNGTRHYPWTLDAASPSADAVRTQENRVDNLEQVLAEGALPAGVWTVAVEGFALAQGPQRFSLVADHPLAGRVDVVCVLDRSGSMGGLATQGQARTKIEALRDAVTQFLDVLQPDVGNRLGLVQFNQDVVPFPAGSDAALAELTAARATALASATVPAIQHGGATSIGDGLEDARAQLAATAAPGRAQSILLVTDGMENQPLWIEDVRTALVTQGIGVYSLGLGFGSGVDEAKLSDLAAATGATYRVTADNLAFRKLFLEAAAGAVDWSLIQDPAASLGAGETLDVPVTVAPDEHLLTFAAMWEGPADAVSFTLLTPGGRTITPQTVARGLRRGGRARDAFYQLDLPLGGDFAADWAGVWRMRLQGRSAALPAGAKALCSTSAYAEGGAKLDLRIGPKARHAGDPVTLLATLRRGGTKLPGATIVVFADVPLDSPGNVIRDAKLAGADLGRVQPPFGDGLSKTEHRLLALTAKLGKAPLRRGAARFALFDDGRHGDGRAGDGVYGAEFRDTKIAGSYGFRVVASGIPACGPLATTREWTISTHLRARPDPEATEVNVTPVDVPAPGTVTVAVTVTPRDAVGNVVGADQAVYLTPADVGAAPFVLEDRGDGTYAGRFRVKAGARLTLFVGGERLRPVPIPVKK